MNPRLIIVIVLLIVLVALLEGCVSYAKVDRKSPTECTAEIRGNVPSFPTPSVIAECR